LPPLPVSPPPFTPGVRYTQERHDAFPVNPSGFLTPDEERLVHHIIRTHEHAFAHGPLAPPTTAWNESEKGRFRDDYFDPVIIPTIEHVPWVLKNIPVPPGNLEKVIAIIRDKIASGVYEPS
ncbi:hypothetical protein BOTBODRAFT_74174, partial [Botryobasidium botryosum FD-172 SS1]